MECWAVKWGNRSLDAASSVSHRRRHKFNLAPTRQVLLAVELAPEEKKKRNSRMPTNASSPAHLRRQTILTAGTLAGLAGGAMEVVWIMLYQSLSGNDAAIVAKGVTQAVFPDLATAPISVTLGLVIHMVLAVGLGIVIAIAVPLVLPRIAGTMLEPVVVVACLVGVWLMNFFVLLPMISPEFVTIVPYPVSFISKSLFGFSAAFVFWMVRRKHASDR
jgi:hypothetical protein